MFKLNVNRSYKYPVEVTIYDEHGKEQTGTFTATFKVLGNGVMRDPSHRGVLLLDLVLTGAEGVEVLGEDGQPLQGDALLKALKDDPAASAALVAAYQESIAKKNRPLI